MHDLPIGAGGTRQFFRTKGLLVPLDRLDCVVEGELRRDRVVPFGNRFLCFRHLYLLRLKPTKLSLCCHVGATVKLMRIRLAHPLPGHPADRGAQRCAARVRQDYSCNRASSLHWRAHDEWIQANC